MCETVKMKESGYFLKHYCENVKCNLNWGSKAVLTYRNKNI